MDLADADTLPAYSSMPTFRPRSNHLPDSRMTLDGEPWRMALLTALFALSAIL